MSSLFAKPQQPKQQRLPVQTPIAVENARRRQLDEAEERQGRTSTIMTQGLTASAGKLGR